MPVATNVELMRPLSEVMTLTQTAGWQDTMAAASERALDRVRRDVVGLRREVDHGAQRSEGR